MTHTAPKSGNRVNILAIALLVVVLAMAILAVVQFGLPILGLLGLVLTVVVFAVMLLFTAGN